MPSVSQESIIEFPVAPLEDILAENGSLEETAFTAVEQLVQSLRSLGVMDSAINSAFEQVYIKEG